MKIYLDNCALGRLTDEQDQPRIQLETQAILAVLRLIRLGVHEWVASPILEMEARGNSNADRRRDTLDLLHFAKIVQR